MRRSSWKYRDRKITGALGLMVAWAIVPGVGLGQEPNAEKPQDPAQQVEGAAAPATKAKTEMEKVLEHLHKTLPSIESIKPLPRPTIPDPPPHEGNLFDYPLTIHPPDVVVVEVLEALPGRPITGERLVRPDGTITLGFYGDVYIRGLTIAQAKTKIILHLRTYLSDERLGLIGTTLPDEIEVPMEEKADATKEAVLPVRPQGVSDRRVSPVSLVRHQKRQQGDTRKNQAAQAMQEAQVDEAPTRVDDRPLNPIAPQDSDRLLVDVSSFNSLVYYVLGDVDSPGRYPWTGGETILDALQHCGGLAPDAEVDSVKLVRPASGETPARAYEVDLKAIQDEGNAKANLQLFPGDRLIVRQKVEQPIEVQPEPERKPQALRIAPGRPDVRTNIARRGASLR